MENQIDGRPRIILSEFYHPTHSLTGEKVAIILRGLKPSEKIDLILDIEDDTYRGFYWYLRYLVLDKKRNIKHFKFFNGYLNIENYVQCLDFFIQFILNNNETTHYEYSALNNRKSMNLEYSRQLTDAITSNNRGQIESFTFKFGFSTTHEGIQLVWDSLLEVGVQVLELYLNLSTEDENDIVGNNNNNIVQREINLESFRTNTTLTNVSLHVRPSMYINLKKIIDAIKMKQRLDSLYIALDSVNFGIEEIKLLVEDVLRENNSLTKIHIFDNCTCDFVVSEEIDEQIRINNLLNINRDWKKYKAMDDDNDEDDEGMNDADDDDDDDDANAVAVADADANANEENTNFTFKKRTLVRMFLHKPIMRDTITFIIVNEFKLALIHDETYSEEGNEHGIILRPITAWW